MKPIYKVSFEHSDMQVILGLSGIIAKKIGVLPNVTQIGEGKPTIRKPPNGEKKSVEEIVLDFLEARGHTGAVASDFGSTLMKHGYGESSASGSLTRLKEAGKVKDEGKKKYNRFWFVKR